MSLHHDPRWPRAGHWFTAGTTDKVCDLNILGVPAHKTSISPTNAHATPAAVRQALLKYSTWSASAGIDLADVLVAVDAGDVDDPDYEGGEVRAAIAMGAAINSSRLAIFIGGDNSITYSGAISLAEAAGGLDKIGVVTLDAHHDVRDGVSNGSPIRRLINDGLDGRNVVQIGISDFANSKEYAQRVSDYGITVIHREDMHHQSIHDVVHKALSIAGANGRAVYLDVDVDVCDRSVAPACPASVPGGLSADELRRTVRAFAADPRVRAIDFTEVDAQADTPDQRTVRLVALSILEIATGLAIRS